MSESLRVEIGHSGWRYLHTPTGLQAVDDDCGGLTPSSVGPDWEIHPAYEVTPFEDELRRTDDCTAQPVHFHRQGKFAYLCGVITAPSWSGE